MELREKIARALFDGAFPTKSPEWLDQEWEARERRRSGEDGDYECKADAVLAVLADLPESVIERASLAIHEHQYLAGSRECKCFKTFRFKEGQQAHRKHRAEAAFRAAFGGEQNDE